MTTKSVEIYAGYFKQGSDFACFLEQNNEKVIPSLRDWAQSLEQAAERLKNIANKLESLGVEPPEVEADTHMIMFNGLSEQTVEQLSKLEGVEVWQDEETDEFCTDDSCCDSTPQNEESQS